MGAVRLAAAALLVGAAGAQEGGGYLSSLVEEVASGTDIKGDGAGWTTYRLGVVLLGDAVNVYTLYGNIDYPLDIPPAYQCATPFGANIGGSSPASLARYRRVLQASLRATRLISRR